MATSTRTAARQSAAALVSDLEIPCEFDAPLGPRTWFGVGGRADVLAQPQNEERLSALTRRCHDAGVPVYVLGSGANLLVRDEGVPGVVVRLDAPGFSAVRAERDRVIVGAGFDLFRLVTWTAEQGLGGLASLAGIPASIGGAVRMNAGGTFGDTGQRVERVRVMDAAGRVRELGRDEVNFGYRHTDIAEPFILGAQFALEPGDPAALRQRAIKLFHVKSHAQPMGEHTAGCTFKNPPLTPPPKAPPKSSSIAPLDVADGKPMPAGMLIDRAGLKGYRVGGAGISQQHANFIVCDRDAGCTAAHVLAVIEHARRVVFEKFGVKLEREVVVWP